MEVSPGPVPGGPSVIRRHGAGSIDGSCTARLSYTASVVCWWNRCPWFVFRRELGVIVVVGFINFCSVLGLIFFSIGLSKIIATPGAASFWKRNNATRRIVVRIRKGRKIDKSTFTRETYAIMYYIGFGIAFFGAGMMLWLW